MAVVAPLAAAPLDKESCDKLQAEKKSLTVMGVEKDMAKGADWAKTNLKPAQLDQVKRFIAVDEQIKFRCHTAVAEPKAPSAKAARAPAAKGAKQAKTAPAAVEGDNAQPAAKTPATNAGQAKAAQAKSAPAAEAPDDKEQD